MPKPVVLCIMDGWGLNPSNEANAVALAKTPNFDRVMAECPNATLSAHGPDVGLPEGQMGNSEVGHMNIGAGRIIWMDLPRIDQAIASGEYAASPVLARFIERIKQSGGRAHIAGLASPGGVHSHQRHIAETAKLFAQAGLEVRIHAFLDGRDVAPKSAVGQIGGLLSGLPKSAKIATVCGRFYAMDRDNRWERVEAAYQAIVKAKGKNCADAGSAITSAYAAGETDEFVTPSVIDGYQGVRAGDGLFFVNFRADRAREILSALADPGFSAFDVSDRPVFAAVCGMVEYSDQHNQFMDVVFPNQEIVNTLGAFVSSQGLKQFRLAETEKYPHVTFFLNGGIEQPYPGEERYMAPSPKVRTYDLQPEMSAAEVTEKLVDAIKSTEFDLIVANYANPDMVGHTGDIDAAIKACEAVDKGVGETVAALDAVGGAMLLTADHGNCEMMVDPVTGGPHTAHTLNPVPVVLVDGGGGSKIRSGRLSDLAPSLLHLMGLEKPAEMTGENLIETA